MNYKDQVFVNLTSKDTEASARFANGLGLTPYEECPAPGAMFRYGESTLIFFHDHKSFNSWLPEDRKIADPTTVAQTIVTLTAPSRKKLDEMVDGAIAAGAKLGPKMVPNEAEYKMYSRSVVDPDGNLFEIVWTENYECSPSRWDMTVGR